MEQHFLKINSEIRLSFYDFGGSGPPLIFCHFTGGLGMLWEPIAKEISRNFHCFAYDARGHGDSSKPNHVEKYNWNEHLQDLLYVLQHIKKITNANFIFGLGHSFGGACLSQAVMLYKELSWKKIIIIEPILGPETFDFRQEAMSHIAKKRRYIFNEEELETRLRKKQPYKNWHWKIWEIYKKYGFAKGEKEDYILKCTPEIESYQYLFGNPEGWFNKMKNIKVPTLIIYGEDSELLPLGEYQLNQIPKSYLVKIPKSGHFIPQEKPEIIIEWIKYWFK